MRLVVGLCPDPLGAYSAPPDSLAGLRGKEGMEKDDAIPLLSDFLPKHPG